MESMSAQELSRLDIKGITIAQPYGELLGEPEKNAVIFIWGEKGAGKSTMSLGLADALAEHGQIEYIPAEEHFGKTLVDRVKRLDATHPNLNFTKWKSIQTLKEILLKNRSFGCVLDSISVIDANAKETVELAQWCRENDIMFIMVAHATKDGQYKGNTSIAHECDIEIKVTKEEGAVTEKNRYKELTTIDVPFTADDREIVRQKPVTPLTEKQHQGVEDQLSNNESATDQELTEYFIRELGLTEAQATHWVGKRDKYLTDPTHSESRENPVDTPFKITLKELDKLHKIRSWKRINSMLGSKMPCYAPRHSGESENAHLSVRYTADYTKKRYIMDLLLDGHLEYQACTEGRKGGLLPCWKKLVSKYGELEIRIYRQDHAKVVLGAKEYKRQERQQAKKQGNDPVKKAKKKSAKKPGKPIVKPTEPAALAPSTHFAPSFDLPKKDRSNIVFRELRTLSSNTPLGIAYAGHDGTVEDIQRTAKRVGAASYDRYGNDLGNMASQYWATGEDGQVKWAISPNFKHIAEITTKAAFEIAGWSLKKWGVDISKFTDEDGTKESSTRQPDESHGEKKQEVDIEAAKKSQAKLDAFLEKILS